MAADVKEQRSWTQHVAQTIGRVYVQAAEGRSVYDTCWYMVFYTLYGSLVVEDEIFPDGGG